MTRTKTQSEPQPTPAAAASTAKQPEQQRKPATPQRPAPLVQRLAATGAPPPAGAPGRARAMAGMQRALGNERVGRAAQHDHDQPVPDAVIRATATTAIQRAPKTGMTRAQQRDLSMNSTLTAQPTQFTEPEEVGEDDLSLRPWREQGREYREDWLQTFEFDPNQPAHVRGWLRNERRRVASAQARGQEAYTRVPRGYVMGHGSATPAREGFDYSNASLTFKDLNDLEESAARRLRYRR